MKRVLATGHEIDDDGTRLDMAAVHARLATTPWGQGRPRALTDRCWSNCLPFGIYDPGDSLVGFGRVLTDYAFRAHIGDVFIDPGVRGLSLGKALIATMLDHPDLATVSTWTLTTQDAHGLYARYGFRLGERDGRSMVLDRSPSPA